MTDNTENLIAVLREQTRRVDEDILTARKDIARRWENVARLYQDRKEARFRLYVAEHDLETEVPVKSGDGVQSSVFWSCPSAVLPGDAILILPHLHACAWHSGAWAVRGDNEAYAISQSPHDSYNLESAMAAAVAYLRRRLPGMFGELPDNG